VTDRATRIGYSATYLVEALALAKYLGERYEPFGVAGLSQGGEAALLISLQASPISRSSRQGSRSFNGRPRWPRSTRSSCPGSTQRTP
jgi:hypothetical protein